MATVLNRYKIIIPSEHGSWSLMLVPFSTGAGVASRRARSSAIFRRWFSAREANFGFWRAHWVSCSALAFSFLNSRSCWARNWASRSSRSRFSSRPGGSWTKRARAARR